MLNKDTPTDSTSKTPRVKVNQINEPPGSALRKKIIRDVWCAPVDVDSPKAVYFGDDGNGNANVAKVAAVKFRHHVKKGTDWKNTALCLNFAMGIKCTRGKRCNNCHRTRAQLQALQSEKAKVVKMDKILKDIYN